MRYLTPTVITGAICWNVAGALMVYVHLYGPTAEIRMWFLLSLAAAVTATVMARIDRRDQVHVPASVSYDLGWQQGYRTAGAKYLGLIEQLQRQLHLLKGHTHGEGQSPSEG